MSEKMLYTSPNPETAPMIPESAFVEQRKEAKERIGKNPISGFEQDNSEKTSLKDRDYQEITVGMIDEKMLDLEEAGLESSANTNAYNGLRDMKDVITDLSSSADVDGMYGDGVKRAEKFKAEGDTARAAAAQDATEFFLRTRSEASSLEGAFNPSTDDDAYDKNSKANIQQAVNAHNNRRSRNQTRRQAM
ncbi:hypothetical protein BH23PAT2_BH23PAT2_09780 [soil metagenome]